MFSCRGKRVITRLSAWSTSNSEIVGVAREDAIVKKPSVVIDYTKNMGANDVADQNLYSFL